MKGSVSQYNLERIGSGVAECCPERRAFYAVPLQNNCIPNLELPSPCPTAPNMWLVRFPWKTYQKVNYEFSWRIGVCCILVLFCVISTRSCQLNHPVVYMLFYSECVSCTPTLAQGQSFCLCKPLIIPWVEICPPGMVWLLPSLYPSNNNLRSSQGGGWLLGKWSALLQWGSCL